MKLHSVQIAEAEWHIAYVSVAAPDEITDAQLQELLKKELRVDEVEREDGGYPDDLTAEEIAAEAEIADIIVSDDGRVAVQHRIDWQC